MHAKVLTPISPSHENPQEHADLEKLTSLYEGHANVMLCK